jgi:SAM-dependent methyltransferase
MDAAAYGEAIAEVYDGLYPAAAPVMLDALATLAGPAGRVLELGIGTGRIALPLVARGLDIHGVDASPAMVARLRAKPGGAALPVTLGDFADVATVPGGRFELVFCAFNTFFALLEQAAQVRCFSGVAAQLADGGRFAIEAFVPNLGHFDQGQALRTVTVGDGQVMLEASRHDPVTQRVSTRMLRVAEDGTKVYPVEIRYAWPSELDLMAQLAGLRLVERWAGWGKQPFGASSGMHVSVYQR